MTLYTVETIVLPSKTRILNGVVDVPNSAVDKEGYCRTNLKITTTNDLVIEKCEVEKGGYYSRMARQYHTKDSYIGGQSPGPLYISAENGFRTLPHDAAALGNSVAQMAILVEQLRQVLEYIHPAPPNFMTYGHQTRNILLLASMDFENECKGVLRAHGNVQQNLGTKDYVKLLEPMRLAEYEIVLPHYPLIPAISPFGSWHPGSPSQTLDWYDSYNAVKHDREQSLEKLHSCLLPNPFVRSRSCLLRNTEPSGTGRIRSAIFLALNAGLSGRSNNISFLPTATSGLSGHRWFSSFNWRHIMRFQMESEVWPRNAQTGWGTGTFLPKLPKEMAGRRLSSHRRFWMKC